MSVNGRKATWGHDNTPSSKGELSALATHDCLLAKTVATTLDQRSPIKHPKCEAGVSGFENPRREREHARSPRIYLYAVRHMYPALEIAAVTSFRSVHDSRKIVAYERGREESPIL